MRTYTRATPYSFIYRMEVVLSIEHKLPLSKVMIEYEVEEYQWLRQRYEELALIDEKILEPQNHVREYQQRITKAYNKKVYPKTITEGNLALKELQALVLDPRGKFKPNQVKSYKVKIVLKGGSNLPNRCR